MRSKTAWAVFVGCLVTAMELEHGASHAQDDEPLTADDARVVVTAHDFNLCDPFPGRGKFGWPGSIFKVPTAFFPDRLGDSKNGR